MFLISNEEILSKYYTRDLEYHDSNLYLWTPGIFQKGTALAIFAGVFQSLSTSLAFMKPNGLDMSIYGSDILPTLHLSYIFGFMTVVLTLFLATVICPEIYKLKTL